MSKRVLGIDIGTASTKGVVTTLDGDVVASASIAHSMSLPRPGWAEVDADAVWWADVVAMCRELVPHAGAHTIAGVCVSGVGPCLLLCDAENRPVRAAILYGIDMRAVAEIDELTERYGGERVAERCGKALTTQAVGPKMLWVRRHQPETWARSSRWYNSHSYAVARLTGEYVLDHHTASQCDPLYDISARDWCLDWAEDVAPSLALPRLVWPSEPVGSVTAAASAETGLPAGTPVVAGTVDAWAEAFSVGVRRPGDLMLMYGSTMFMVQVLPNLKTSPMLWTTAGVEPDSYTLAAGMATSGSLTAWLQDLTGGAPFHELVREAAAMPPGADGLLVLPYFAGERTPVFDPQARGVIVGLSLRHRRGHLYRAAYEGVAFGIRQILELFDAAGGPATRAVAVGGGTRGGLWTRIVTDVTGRVQELPEQTIGASFGAALLAAVGSQSVPRDTDWSRIGDTITPDDSQRELYDTLYHSYCDLYPATRAHAHLLAEIQERGAGNPQP